MLLLKNKPAVLLFLLILISGLLPFLLVSFYNHPTIDDFYLANLINQSGLFKTQSDLYNNWSGRFASTFLVSVFNPLLYRNWLIINKVCPIVFLLTLLISFTFLFRVLFRYEVSLDRCFFLSTIILIAFLQKIEIVSEFIYWFTGAITYLSPLIAFILYLGFTVLYFTSVKNKTIYFIAAVLWVLFIVGANEVSLINFLFVHSAITAYLIFSHRKKAEIKLFLSGWVLIFLAAFIALQAPGNFVRVELTPIDATYKEKARSLNGIMHLSIKAAEFVILKLKEWLSSLPLLAASLLFSAFLWKYKNATTILIRREWQFVCYILFVFISLVIQIIPVLFGLSIVVDRVWNVVLFHFIIYWFLGLYLIVPYVQKISQVKITVPARIKPTLLNIFLLIFLGLNLTSLHVLNAWKDLLLKAPQYDLRYKARYAQIEKLRADGIKSLTVEPAFFNKSEYPRTIFFRELSADSNRYVNKNISEYFKINSIRLSETPK